MESKMESALKKLKRDMDFYKTNDTCPTCYQGIDQEFKETRLEKAELKQNEFADGFVKLEESIADIKNKLEVMDTIYNDVIKHQNEIIRLNSVLTTNKNHVIMIQNSMANVKENSTSVGNLQQLDDELEDLTGQINRLNEEKEYLDTALTYLKDSGIKAKIIKKYVPLLNATINKYLQKLKLYFTFQIDENFKEKLKARHRDEFSYENMSEGEKLRLDLAILFSFREISKIKNSVNCNILIMDEIMDSSLDDMGQVELIDILSEFINQNIFIISHKTDNILDSFERVLEFEKKGNFAKLCEVVL
jgi:DNA repair exonuclease SbcCD ATPase subunit